MDCPPERVVEGWAQMGLDGYGGVLKLLVRRAGDGFHMVLATMEAISVEHRAKLLLSEYTGMMIAYSMPTINTFLCIPPFQILLTNRACMLCLHMLHCSLSLKS